MADIDDLATGGAYRRDFTGGFVLANPAEDGPALTVDLGGLYRLGHIVVADAAGLRGILAR